MMAEKSVKTNFDIDDDDEGDGTSSTLQMVELGDAISTSLPSPEEIRTDVPVYSKPYTSLRRCGLYAGFAIALFALILIPTLVTVSNNKNNNNNNSLNSNADPPRVADFDSVKRYMIDQGVSSEDAFSSTGTPQYRAATWLAQVDGANLPVPTSNIRAFDGYRYVARYVMAVNFYALNGENWPAPEIFMNDDDICFWHTNFMSIGVYCYAEGDKGYMPFAVRLRKFGCRCYCYRILVGSFKWTHHSATFVCIPIIANFNLKGDQIPEENGALWALEFFNMEVNDIKGTIPSTFCSLTDLNSLYLNYNRLTGRLPDCLSRDLIVLVVSDNFLTGSLPTQYGNMAQLQHLLIDDNILTGDPISTISKLYQLRSLFISTNEFTGDIDSADFQELTFLALADLSHNNFTSTEFPTQFLEMRSLQFIDISRNQLSGAFPTTLSENRNLLSFSAYDNQFSGSIPSSISNLKYLQHIDLSTNDLTGEIPETLGDMSKLEYVFLSENAFTVGPIPDSFGKLNATLQELSLRSTNRIGPLPEFLSELTLLELLDLGSNELEGQIPESYGSLSNLKFFLLNVNDLITGQVPSSFEKLVQLRYAYLDDTGLTGNLTVLCDLPIIGDESENRVIYADCGTNGTITCDCRCTCCKDNLETGCSRPGLANSDLIWEAGFGRYFYDFRPAKNDTKDDDFVRPPKFL
jgi:Leucine-rich repeat (LRR) protein